MKELGRRALLGHEEIGVRMYGTSFYKSATSSTGKIETAGNVITITSTGSPVWTLNVNPNSNYGTIADYLGHTIKVITRVTWLNKPDGASLVVSIGGFTGANAGTRNAYFELPVSKAVNTATFVLTKEKLSNQASKYNANNPFLWKAYLYSSAGGSVRFSIDVYDLGVK